MKGQAQVASDPMPSEGKNGTKLPNLCRKGSQIRKDCQEESDENIIESRHGCPIGTLVCWFTPVLFGFEDCVEQFTVE